MPRGNFRGKKLEASIKKGRFDRSGKRGNVFVLPIKSFVPSLCKITELRKLSGAQMGSVHQLSYPFLPYTSNILPLLSHSINVSLTHRLPSSMVLIPWWSSQEGYYFQVGKRNCILTSTCFKGGRNLLTLHILRLHITRINSKKTQRLGNHFLKLHNHKFVT